MNAVSSGLEDVVAAETVLSMVDGLNGRLVIRGRSLDQLAGRTRFEDLVGRLWEGFLPVGRDLAARLGRARAEVFDQVAALDDGLLALEPLEAVRALTARLPDGDDLDTALRLLAAPAVFAPAVIRRRQGLPALGPEPAAGHAADMLRMLGGQAPSPAEAAALDTYLVTVSDHGLNASTFAARVVASTQAGLTSAVLAGISALKGPLHGGAPGPVIEMLDAIDSPANAGPWLQAALARGERLMGFGHRVYRVRDPRADALKAAYKTVGGGPRLALAEAVEATALDALRQAKPDRRLETNVEFYTALLLEALGVPADAFTCVFAMGRTAGWIAHAREQLATGRLIRPQSVYVGSPPSACWETDLAPARSEEGKGLAGAVA